MFCGNSNRNNNISFFLMMDVNNSNKSNTSYRNYLKKSNISMSTMKFSIETYFVWFSALIFITELITDICLVVYYFHQREIRWGLMTLAIIMLPLMMCQLYSLILLRSQKSIGFSILIVHLLLMGIPYRYHTILRRVDTDKMTNQELENVQQMINDVKNLQTLNAIFQYCPQFIFQAFLIVYKNYKCIITGVSAGLAAFSFLWHNFIHFYYYIKKLDINRDCIEATEINTQIIDNLTVATMTTISSSSSTAAATYTSSSLQVISSTTAPSSIMQTTAFVPARQTQFENNDNDDDNEQNEIIPMKNYKKSILTENIKIFEKPLYNTDDKNFVSKKQQWKHVEKNKIFNFENSNNKCKALYESNNNANENENNSTRSAGVCNTTNMSTIFFEISSESSHHDNTIENNGNELSLLSSSTSASKLNLSFSAFLNNNKTEDYHNENNTNINLINNKTNRNINSYDLMMVTTTNTNSIDDNSCIRKMKYARNIGNCIGNSIGDSLTETRTLKRKGICSSQEMLHLVDVMNDIPPEEIDMLAKSLIEMGCEDSLKNVDNIIDMNCDNSKLLENFPEYLDDEKIIENIDAVIYENQIIFQERIRKNQLTIQNLKLQDQLLSKYIEEIKNLPSNELINIRDYENMCFANVSRTNRLKHWRNYLQDINTSLHDSSTVQNSSFYVNTMSNSLTDLYVNGTDIGSVVTEDGKLSDQISLPLSSSAIGNSGGGSGSGVIGEYSNSKKCVRWSEKLIIKQNDINNKLNELDSTHHLSINRRHHNHHVENENKVDDDNYEDHDNINDNLYININGPNIYAPRKNILVETINAINDVESPIISHLKNKKKSSQINNNNNISIMNSIMK